ncbi:LGFP repeat-containing protein, partial [Blastococcus sp. LR1]|uniref:LGFP repeat-containing protein n=1 Tax=Blastococcus sp. LR1 TaxID=2877000 RepID=UPI0035B12388|nr:hypothetical protein [Blastococcus sp. LR1]
AFAGNAAIYDSPAGVHVVQGSIRDLWASQGYETGPLGYPTADEKVTPDGKGRYSEFERGVITWTPAGGARSISGDVVAKWRSLGGLTWERGLPVTSTLRTPDRKAWFNAFAGNAAIYDSPAGVHVVQGSIRDLWASQGYETGPLGYPTADEKATSDGKGRYSSFQIGTVFWTPALGPQAVYGSIFARYQALGGVTSRLGYPTTSEYAVPGGRANDFEQGRITWNATTGAVTVTYR